METLYTFTPMLLLQSGSIVKLILYISNQVTELGLCILYVYETYLNGAVSIAHFLVFASR